MGIALQKLFAPSRFCSRPVGFPLAVLVLALLTRGGVLLLTPNALQADPDGYWRLAENLVEHGTFGEGSAPTAFRPPLYPVVLTGCVAAGDWRRAAIGALHVVLGVATVGLVLVLGQWWGLGRCGAALAALLVACDPILLSQSTQVMTETTAAFLAVLGLLSLAWMRRRPTSCRALLAGATLATGALCRPTLLLWAVAVGVMLLWQAWSTPKNNLRRSSGRRRTVAGGVAKGLRLPIAFALGAVFVLSPWAVRNQLQLGRPIVTTTHGGYTFLLANNPSFYEWLRDGQWGSVWPANEFNADWDRRKPHDELRADRLAYAEAERNIYRKPGAFVGACLVRIGRFWSPLPHRVIVVGGPRPRLMRYAVALWYTMEFLLAAAGVWIVFHRKERSAWMEALLLVACLAAVHAFFWTNMRMRAPVMPVVAMAAAVAWRRLRRNRR